MPRFIINSNPQPNGDHEVHNATTGCSYMPAPANQIDLGSTQPVKVPLQMPNVAGQTTGSTVATTVQMPVIRHKQTGCAPNNSFKPNPLRGSA